MTERQEFKALINRMKATRMGESSYKTIRAAKRAFNKKFGRRK